MLYSASVLRGSCKASSFFSFLVLFDMFQDVRKYIFHTIIPWCIYNRCVMLRKLLIFIASRIASAILFRHIPEQYTSDYTWKDYVSDQLIMTEGSIRRNFLTYADEFIFISHLKYEYLHENKYTDKEAWLEIFGLASHIDLDDFEEDMSLQRTKKSLKILLQRKIDTLYDTLYSYSKGSSENIFDKENIVDKVVNTSADDIYKIIKNELKTPLKVLFNNARKLKRDIPFVLELTERNDWNSCIKLILENQENSLPKRNKKDRKLKLLSDYINNVESFGQAVNNLFTAYNKALDSTCACIRNKMKDVYAEIKSKFDDQYEEYYITAFYAVLCIEYQNTLKNEISRTEQGLDRHPVEQFKILRECEYFLHCNINKAFKKSLEKMIHNLRNVPYYDQFQTDIIRYKLHTDGTDSIQYKQDNQDQL